MLAERLDGVALLTEALNHRNALGRYHELVRLFERAFHLGPYGLFASLVPFLTDSAAPHGFTEQEIHVWINARPEATHADRRPTYVLEADVRPWIARMLEAAFDVLLNKADWRQPTTTRRNRWRPAAGSSDPNAGMFLTQGREASLEFQILDGFKAYPLMLAGPVESILPAGVWLDGDADGGKLKTNESDVRIDEDLLM